jgi:Lar family restriction alleviation protein
MTKDLKPCPFCGGTEVKLDCEARNRTGEYVFKYEIRCLSCPAIFNENAWYLDPCEAKQDIIDKWNTRLYENEEDRKD